MRALVLLIACACGAKSPTTAVTPAVSSELSAALAPLGWWLGDWQAEDGGNGTEHWVAASGAMYGIALHDDDFEVMVVDDGDGRSRPDGIVRFIAMPGGVRAVEFRRRQLEGSSVTFANDEHDYPKAITYTREGDQLRALLGGGARSDRFRWRRTMAAPARELEQADIAFARDVGARGVDAWVDAFAPAGAMMTKDGRVEGADAIRELMKPLLDTTKVDWGPIASARRGDVGFTVGKATFVGPEDSWRTTYVTIWKKQPDGAWKVLFDTGRTVNE